MRLDCHTLVAFDEQVTVRVEGFEVEVGAAAQEGQEGLEIHWSQHRWCRLELPGIGEGW